MNLGQIHKLMDRKKTSHKGENGYALVVGGSENYVTAPALAAIAALRSGCDLAAVAAPEKVAWTINMLDLDLVTHKIPGETLNIKNAKDALKVADRYDAVLLGNGSTRDSDVFNQMFVRKCARLKVVDADALKTLSFKDFHNSVVTPHWAELEILLINSGKEFLIQKLRDSNVKEQADILQGNLRYFLHNNNVLLVKGATDIIISRNKIAFNRTGNPGMTKAGTGDVLAGLCVGFLAKTQDMFKSAVAAAYINGFIGDLLLKKHEGYSFIASDLLEDLAQLQREIEALSDKEEEVKKVAAKHAREEKQRMAQMQSTDAETAAKLKEQEKALKDAVKAQEKAQRELARALKKVEALDVKMQKAVSKEQEKLAREKKKLDDYKKKVAAEKARLKEAEAKKKAKALESKKKATSKKTVKKVAKKKPVTKKKTVKKASKKPASKKAKKVAQKKVVKKKATKKKAAKKSSKAKKKKR